MNIDWSKFPEWLKSQPEDREFDYWSLTACMIVSFIRESYGESCVELFYILDAPDKLRFATVDADQQGRLTIGAVKKLLGV